MPAASSPGRRWGSRASRTPRPRHRRLGRRRGRGDGDRQGRAVGRDRRDDPAGQGPAAARDQGSRADRPRDPLPPALPRPDRQPRRRAAWPTCAAHGRGDPGVPRRARLRRGRDPGAPGRGRRRRPRGRSSRTTTRSNIEMYLRIALELPPQAADRRRLREGLRDRPRLPQRGPRHPPQPRVHHARGLRGARGLPRHDGAHRARWWRRRRSPPTAPRSSRSTGSRSTWRPRGAGRRCTSSSRSTPASTSTPRCRSRRRAASPPRPASTGRTSWGSGKICDEIYDGRRRAPAGGPDLRLRPPARDLSAGPRPPRRPDPGRALRGGGRGPRAGQRLQRADRPGRPAHAGSRPRPARRRPATSRPATSTRTTCARMELGHAAHRRPRHRRRPPGDAARRRRRPSAR